MTWAMNHPPIMPPQHFFADRQLAKVSGKARATGSTTDFMISG